MDFVCSFFPLDWFNPFQTVNQICFLSAWLIFFFILIEKYFFMICLITRGQHFLASFAENSKNFILMLLNGIH